MPAHSNPFVGRQGEMGVLQRALAEAGVGPSRTVLVQGEPGTGKTALVGSFLAANPAVRSVWVSGAADEVTVQYAVVDQLRRATGRPPARVDAIAAAVELVDIVDALPAPVAVLVIDDLQWVDPDSRRALLYLLRRLPRRGALVVCTAPPDVEQLLGRSWARVFTAPDRSCRLHLDGLDAGEVRQLAAHRGRRLGRSAARRLREHTDGNPLHVSALLEELTGEALNDPTRPLPAPRAYAARVLARVALLTPEARALVNAASIFGTHAPLRAVLAIAGPGVTAPALDEVVAHRLLADEVRAGMRELSFPRALTRAAVYHGLSASRRCSLHAAAARSALAVPAAPCPFVHLCRDGAAPCALAEVRPDDTGRQPLTERERSVVSLVRRGLTNREIAAALFVSTKTVEYHVHNVFEKLGLHTRRELWWLWDQDGRAPEMAQTATNGTSQAAD